MLIVSADQARAQILATHGLATPPAGRETLADLLGRIETLGFVQIDSINTVARAHHMILFARSRHYHPRHLARLHERERSLFENWTHDASIIPTRYYPYWRHRFVREQNRLREQWRGRIGAAFEAELEAVVRHITTKGPTRARDLNPSQDRQEPGWWNWHPAKVALEFLWRTGRLAVARREGFQKVYDLTERVVDPTILAAEPSQEAFVDWACRSALERLVFATPGEIAGFWDLVTAEEAKVWCEQNRGDGVIAAAVEGVGDGQRRQLFARADLADRLGEAEAPCGRLRILNPFDPLLRDRRRLLHLFGFDYRIEVFVPAAKRRYGYYVFAILEGDRLVGRIDIKAERGAGLLVVQGLWWEPWVRRSKARAARLDQELDRLRRFCDLDDVVWRTAS